jgi:hypothetical protein
MNNQNIASTFDIFQEIKTMADSKWKVWGKPIFNLVDVF